MTPAVEVYYLVLALWRLWWGELLPPHGYAAAARKAIAA